MLNFSVGPVMSCDEVKRIAGEDIPYFRTSEFSEIMLENEKLMCEFVGAPDSSRAVFVTASGTGSMEAVVLNTLTPEDKVLVVVGGSFGARFEQLLTLHGIPHDTLKLEPGRPLTKSDLVPYEQAGYSAFVVNIHETSTGILYDKQLIADFVQRNNLFCIVDAISSFLADPLDMEALGADVVIVGSQKALAVAPGISIDVLSPRAQERIDRISCPVMYFDFSDMLSNGLRGQTPFTPAVGVLLQIHERLKQIQQRGVASEISRVSNQAADFRLKAQNLPFAMRLISPSNAVTYIELHNNRARDIFETLKERFDIWVCPNGGACADTSFRVGHIGALTVQDNDTLLSALTTLAQEGMFSS